MTYNHDVRLFLLSTACFSLLAVSLSNEHDDAELLHLCDTLKAE